jgi:hypothetical protein
MIGTRQQRGLPPRIFQENRLMQGVPIHNLYLHIKWV